MTEIATPRTDALVVSYLDAKALARQLERKLAVTLEALQHITLTEDDDLKVSRNGMFRSAISAIQRIEAMRRQYEEGK